MNFQSIMDGAENIWSTVCIVTSTVYPHFQHLVVIRCLTCVLVCVEQLYAIVMPRWSFMDFFYLFSCWCRSFNVNIGKSKKFGTKYFSPFFQGNRLFKEETYELAKAKYEKVFFLPTQAFWEYYPFVKTVV